MSQVREVAKTDGTVNLRPADWLGTFSRSVPSFVQCVIFIYVLWCAAASVAFCRLAVELSAL